MEKLQSYERVIIANNQITLMAAQLVHLRSDLLHANTTHASDFLVDRVNDIDEMLGSAAAEVIEVMNKIADFMNGIDAVSELDIHLFDGVIESLNDVCYEACENCEKNFDMDTMTADADDNYFCPRCWEALAPVMKQEYDDMVKSGEIEED